MTSPTVGAATDADFDQRIAEGIVLVDFWAPWCAPCRAIAPMLEQVATAHAGKLSILKVNVDENPIVAHRHAIRSIPTLLLFNEGQRVDTIVGAPSRAYLDRWIATSTGLNTAA